MSDKKCTHCGISGNECSHPKLCCDCYDLSWGMPLKDINAERLAKGLPPIEREWPKASR